MFPVYSTVLFNLKTYRICLYSVW